MTCRPSTRSRPADPTCRSTTAIGTGPIAYVYPTGGPACGAAGNPCGPDGIADTPDDLFGTGIQLVDPVGSGVCSQHDPNLGNNIILVTFDLQLRGDVTPGDVINTSEPRPLCRQ